MRLRCRTICLFYSLGKTGIAVFLLFATLQYSRADFLEEADEKLSLNLFQDRFRARLSGLLDLETYFIDQRPPGLIDAGAGLLFNPRLSLFLDEQLGQYFYIFAQARADRGFDPANNPLEVRMDEYLLRFTPRPDALINFQIGKFATVVGNFVSRHDSWNNAFITAPLPYENITTVSDSEAPSSPQDFAGHKFETDEQYERLPIIWNANYTSGAAVFGSIEKFDYAFEVKNASISSRPDSWDATQVDWSNPSVAGRIGSRPTEAWNFGVSASVGSYMQPLARETLPPGKNIDDYDQITIAQDISYSWRHLQLWAEIFESRFEVPTVGNADTLSYYIEARYKIAPQLFAAARWNQQFYATVPDGTGGEQPWGNDIWRVDAALGYRFTRYLQGKVQYSFSHQDAAVQQGEQLVAAQLTLKF